MVIVSEVFHVQAAVDIRAVAGYRAVDHHPVAVGLVPNQVPVAQTMAHHHHHISDGNRAQALTPIRHRQRK